MIVAFEGDLEAESFGDFFKGRASVAANIEALALGGGAEAGWLEGGSSLGDFAWREVEGRKCFSSAGLGCGGFALLFDGEGGAGLERVAIGGQGGLVGGLGGCSGGQEIGVQGVAAFFGTAGGGQVLGGAGGRAGAGVICGPDRGGGGSRKR